VIKEREEEKMGMEPVTRKRSISRIESSNTVMAGLSAPISNSIFSGTEMA